MMVFLYEIPLWKYEICFEQGVVSLKKIAIFANKFPEAHILCTHYDDKSTIQVFCFYQL